MNIVLSFPSTKNPLQIATTPLCSFNVKPTKTSSVPKYFHARDKVIDFGKYKGKMLGTLPSTYLKWVSNTLRAKDFEEWAKLADEVLDDPVYRDRIEWEFAEKLLNGDVKGVKHGSAVSELVELSERFGWDNEDKLGWSNIDFSVLGTSKGGRIPRLEESGKSDALGSRRVDGSRKIGSLGSRMMDTEVRRFDGSRKDGSLDSRMMNKEIQRLDESRNIESWVSRMTNKGIRGSGESRKIESLDTAMRNEGIRGGNEGVGETRKERRERLRSRRSGGDSMKELRGSMEKMGVEEKNEGRLASSDDFRVKGNEDVDERGNVEIQSRFPGRDGLLRKVLSRRTSF